MQVAHFDRLWFPSAIAPPVVSQAQPGVPDEDVAGGSDARLLITAPSRELVETLAMRVHAANRPAMPFVQVAAGALPSETSALSAMCVSLLDSARGGSLLVTNVEEMSVAVQKNVLGVIEAIQDARGPSATVRLMSGTTVCLLERVSAGAFSERLFYRLNLVHIRVPASSRDTASLVR